jgi:hypothetical protein
MGEPNALKLRICGHMESNICKPACTEYLQTFSVSSRFSQPIQAWLACIQGSIRRPFCTSLLLIQLRFLFVLRLDAPHDFIIEIPRLPFCVFRKGESHVLKPLSSIAV